MEKTKICIKCKEEKPLSKEYFYTNKTYKDGFGGTCKVCLSKYYQENKERCKANYQENKEHSKIYYQENKERYKMYYQENKESIKYYYEENKEKHLEYQRKYRQDNKEQIYKRKTKYRKENKEKIAEYDSKYYKANKEHVLERTRKYIEDNKERYIENRKKYYQENPHIFKQAKQRRKAIKNKLPSSLTIGEWEKIKSHFNNECAYCGLGEQEHLEKYNQQLNQEHFVALSNGGEYTHNNIIPSCKSCNSSKHNTDYFEWYPKQEFYSKKREKFILAHLGYDNKTSQQLSVL